MMPARIQRKRTKDWTMPENTVYVGRPSRWGNPWCVGKAIDRQAVKKWDWRFKDLAYITPNAEDAMRKFAVALGLDDCMIAVVRRELKGKNLACWCPPGAPCHADVLIEIANSGDQP